MAIQLLNWAFKQNDLIGADKWVLIVLANRADKKTHQCFPSLNQIADDAGIDRSTVTRCITHLLDAGIIRREKWGAQRTMYTIELGASRTRCATQLGAPRTRVGASRTQLDEPASLLTNTENTEETIINRKPAAQDLAYDIFVDVFRDTFGAAPYLDGKGDFVCLSRLRKKMNLESRAAPEFWREACVNYLASDLGKFTICDLCSRYAIFLKGRVDRFNKPVKTGNNGKVESSFSSFLREFDIARCEVCEVPHDWKVREPYADTTPRVMACPDWKTKLKK